MFGHDGNTIGETLGLATSPGAQRGVGAAVEPLWTELGSDGARPRTDRPVDRHRHARATRARRHCRPGHEDSSAAPERRFPTHRQRRGRRPDDQPRTGRRTSRDAPDAGPAATHYHGRFVLRPQPSATTCQSPSWSPTATEPFSTSTWVPDSTAASDHLTPETPRSAAPSSPAPQNAGSVWLPSGRRAGRSVSRTPTGGSRNNSVVLHASGVRAPLRHHAMAHRRGVAHSGVRSGRPRRVGGRSLPAARS